MDFTIEENKIESIVGKIITETDQGSAVIWKVNEQFSYILTCAHVIKEFEKFILYIRNGTNIEKIEISSIIDKFENDKNDTAIIVIDNNVNKIFMKYFNLKSITGQFKFEKNMDLLLSGYPGIRNNNEKFNNIIIDKCRFSGIDRLRTENKLETHTTFALDNCRGFSGGGIFLKYNNKLFLSAIVKEYYEELNYFEIITIDKYNALLQDAKYPLIDVYNNDIIHIENILSMSTENVNNINIKIGNDIELPRKEIVNIITKANEKINIISGEPGIGKSVIIRKVIDALNPTYFICERGENITREYEFSSIKSLLNINSNDVVVIVDSCEKIFENENDKYLKKFIETLYTYNNVKIFLGIRDYSEGMLDKLIRFDCRIDENTVNKISIPDINEDFSIITKHYPQIISLAENTKKLLKNPFYLNIIVTENQIGNIKDITNEYQIKDFIWNVITKNNVEIERALINIAKKRLDSNKEFIEISLSQNIIDSLIKSKVLKKNNLLFAFTHDKFEDIAAKKLLDNLYINNDIKSLICNIKNELSYGRIFKLWVKDRLSNNELQVVNTEIDNLYSDGRVSYLWKWNIIEAVYESNRLYEYLKINIKKLEDNLNFFKRIFDIIISSDLSDIGKKIKPKMGELKQYFSYFVIPSGKIFIVLNFLYTNKTIINKKNILYVAKIMEESTRVLYVYGNNIWSNFKYVSDLLDYCIKKISSEKYYFDDSVLKSLEETFLCYAQFDATLGKKYINNIISQTNLSDFEKHLYKDIIAKNSDRLLIIPEEFSRIYYNDILSIFLVYTKKSSCRRNTYDFREEDKEYFGIVDDYEYDYPCSNKLILYDLLNIDFNKALDYILDYINGASEEYFNNSRYLKYNTVSQKYFMYKGTVKYIYFSNNFISAYRSHNNIPVIITSILMSLERCLLQKSEKENISAILDVIINKANNYMFISLVIGIVYSDLMKYGSTFIEVSYNDYIRTCEIEKNFFEQRNKFFRTNDILEEFDRKTREKYKHRKYHYDNVFCYLQSIEHYADRMFVLIDRLNRILLNNKGDDSLIISNFLYECDMRNYIPIINNMVNIERPSKEIEDFQIENEKKSNLLDKYSKFVYYLMFGKDNNINVNVNDVKIFIEELIKGVYEDIGLYTINYLKLYICIFIVRNPELYDKNKIIEVRNEIIKKIDKINANYHTSNQIEITKIFDQIPYLLKKSTYEQKQIISQFILENIIYGEFNYENEKIIKDIIYQLRIEYPYIIDNIYETLLQLIKRKDTNLVIKYKNRLSFAILNKLNRITKKFHRNNIEINIENILLIKGIILLENIFNYKSCQEYLIEVLKLLKNNSSKDIKINNEYSLFIEFQKYLVNEIKNDSKDNCVLKYILDNYIDFTEILLQVVDTLNAEVQDKTLNEDCAWSFIKKVLDKILLYENIESLYITIENHYVENENDLNVGKLLMTCLLISSNWISQLNPKEILLINYNKNEYLEYNKKFISSKIGILNLSKLLVKYNLQFDYKTILDFTGEILKYATNEGYFSEGNTMFYIEEIIEKIYVNYNQLNKDERNKFYKLLTCIGCNAPSPFLLYIKRILEF